jgi:arylsulfatase A-like enzyme
MRGTSLSAFLDRHGSAAAAALLAVLVFGVFGEFLLGADDRIPSDPTGDTAKYFLSARSFAVEQILAGNFPLWNPHTFSGTPFVGTFQSSALYPLNVLHLLLPPALAFSLDFALHVFLLGFFFVLWLRGHRVHGLAAAFGAAAVMFGSTCILRVLAGQCTVLATFTWFPLLLLAIDKLAQRPGIEWTVVGMAAVTAMALAGHPPTLLMAGLVAGLYCAPALWRSTRRAARVGSFACIAGAPFLLAAVQLWPGLEVAAGAARGGGGSYAWATSFSLPPENLLTLVAPGFFGDGPGPRYFGRWWYWDASAYFGVVAFALAVHGAASVRPGVTRRASVLAVVLTLLALGRYTPFYALLYHTLPLLSYVRAPSKFLFFATLFLASLTAIGADRLIADPKGARRTVPPLLLLTLVLGSLSLWQATASEPASLTHLLAGFRAPRRPDHDLQRWAAQARGALLAATVFAGATTAALYLAPRWRGAIPLLLLGGAIELLLFANANHGAMSLSAWAARDPILLDAYAKAGERRVLEAGRATNRALAVRGHNIWGYDPVFPQRYAELIAFTQGVEVTNLDNNTGRRPRRFHPLLSMLRVGIEARARDLVEHPDALPRAFLVHRHRVVRGAEAVLAALARPDFDPRRVVVLEEAPDPPPRASGGAGSVEAVDLSTDRLRLDVELAAPAILVVTDAYAPGWQAEALPGSAASAYRVLRANAVLRAVALGPGHHRFDLVYAPATFRAGAWVSGTSALLVLAALFWARWRRRGRRMRREGPRLTTAVLLALWLAGCGGQSPPPNILLYVVDTLRADSLAPYGNPVVETPAASRLAREGVLYERAYAHSAWTRPSIASLLTGRLPDEHRVESRDQRAGSELRLLSEALAEAGYTTGAIVTNPNVGAVFGFDQGYQDFIELFTRTGTKTVSSGAARARSDVVTDRALAWIDTAPEPFFLFVLTTDPHSPYAPPKRFDRYARRRDPRPRGASYRANRRVERQRTLYYGEVAFNDHSLGRLLRGLGPERLERTVVILTSDHGEEFGDHGYRWHGRTLFEEIVRVPLIVRRPGEEQPGRRISQPVQLIDLHPTLLHLAGLPVPGDLPGIVLPPEEGAAPRSVFARLELDGYISRMLLAPPWKWIETSEQPRRERRRLTGLFDLDADPFESDDRASERPELVGTMRRVLEGRARHSAQRPAGSAEEISPGALPDDVRSALEVLGYLEVNDSDVPRGP